MARSAAVVTTIIAALAALGCAEVVEEVLATHAGASIINPERPECPQSWRRVPIFDSTRAARRDSSGVMVTSVAFISLPNGVGVAGPVTDMPEFHDCQKFIVERTAGIAYDSLFAIFASPVGDSVISALQWDSVAWSSSNAAVATVSASGVVQAVGPGVTTVMGTAISDPQRKVGVALTVVPGAANAPHDTIGLMGAQSLPPNALHPGESLSVVALLGKPTTSTLAVAQVYAYGPGYPALGIGPNFSCLYLYFDPTGALRAKMVHAAGLGSAADACVGAADPQTATGTDLEVNRSAPGNAGDFPAFARWGFDEDNKRYYIGLSCGPAWCDIGVPSARTSRPFKPRPARTVPTGTTPGERRVMTVKGWYDEQLLAIVDAYGVAIPSTLFGVVTPAPGLTDLTLADFNKKWVRTAFVALDDSRPGAAIAAEHYRRKFNFKVVSPTAPLAQQNVLSLCFGSRTKCGVPAPPTGKGCGPDQNSSGIPYARWWTRIDPAGGGPPMYRCVTRRDHAGISGSFQIPSSARWRWLAMDETIWEECVAGCCETEGDQVSPGWPP